MNQDSLTTYLTRPHCSRNQNWLSDGSQTVKLFPVARKKALGSQVIFKLQSLLNSTNSQVIDFINLGSIINNLFDNVSGIVS